MKGLEKGLERGYNYLMLQRYSLKIPNALPILIFYSSSFSCKKRVWQ